MMSKLYDAYKQIRDAVEDVMIDAGFARGTSSDVASQTSVMFWFMNLTSKDAGQKQKYITYNILSLSPNHRGDGEVLSRQAEVQINIYSAHVNCDNEFQTLNNAFLASTAFGNFEFSDLGYDSGTQLYRYSFTVKSNVIGDYIE
jgi:hypothetical protein